MDHLSDILKELGLNEKEIEILSFLHAKGGAYASTLANHLKLQRSTCYEILKRLQQEGLVSQIYRNDIQYFLAVEISSIFEKWKMRQQQLDKKYHQFKKNLDARAGVEALKAFPRARYFTGPEGIKDILLDVLKVQQPAIMRSFISKDLSDFISRHLPEYPYVRSRSKISAKVIFPHQHLVNFFKEPDQSVSRETRLLPEYFDLGIDCLIYGGKIAIISVQENFGLIIESEGISKAQSKLFELAWQMAHKINPTSHLPDQSEQ